MNRMSTKSFLPVMRGQYKALLALSNLRSLLQEYIKHYRFQKRLLDRLEGSWRVLRAEIPSQPNHLGGGWTAYRLWLCHHGGALHKPSPELSTAPGPGLAAILMAQQDQRAHQTMLRMIRRLPHPAPEWRSAPLPSAAHSILPQFPERMPSRVRAHSCVLPA